MGVLLGYLDTDRLATVLKFLLYCVKEHVDNLEIRTVLKIVTACLTLRHEDKREKISRQLIDFLLSLIPTATEKDCECFDTWGRENESARAASRPSLIKRSSTDLLRSPTVQDSLASIVETIAPQQERAKDRSFTKGSRSATDSKPSSVIALSTLPKRNSQSAPEATIYAPMMESDDSEIAVVETASAVANVGSESAAAVPHKLERKRVEHKTFFSNNTLDMIEDDMQDRCTKCIARWRHKNSTVHQVTVQLMRVSAVVTRMEITCVFVCRYN